MHFRVRTLYFDLSYTKTGISVYETLYFDLPSIILS